MYRQGRLWLAQQLRTSSTHLPAAAVDLVDGLGMRLHARHRRIQPLQVPQLQPACTVQCQPCAFLMTHSSPWQTDKSAAA